MPAINLLPKSDFEKSTTGRVINWLLSTFRYLVIAVELIVIIGFITRFWLDMLHANLDDQIKEHTQVINSYQEFEQRFRLTKTKLQMVSELTAQPKLTSLITDINNRLPEDLALTKIEKNPEKFSIEGVSLQEQSIAQLIANLNELDQLKNIKLTRLNSEPDSIFINFTLEQVSNNSNNQKEGGKQS